MMNTLSEYAPVGATVRSAYWGETYTVLSHNEDGSVTVEWSDSTRSTHTTPLGERDIVFSVPS